MHLWDVWNRLDYEHYRSHRPRFVAEFGFQAPPTAVDARRRGHRPGRSPSTAAELQHHQKATDGDGQAAPRPRPPLRRGRRLRRLAVPHPGQPGAGHRGRRRALPRPARALLGRRVVAARRLLAVDQLGGRRPCRTAQAELVRPAPVVRRPPARPRAPRRPTARPRRRCLVNDAAEAWETARGGQLVSPAVASSTAVDLSTPSSRPRSNARARPAARLAGGDGLVVATAGPRRAVHGRAGIDRFLSGRSGTSPSTSPARRSPSR